MASDRDLSGGTTVVYDDTHWELLSYKRDIAKVLLSSLSSVVSRSYVFGSVARGDIHQESDIDILIIDVVPSYKIDINLDKIISEHSELRYGKKSIVMATPNSPIKGVYEMHYGDNEITIHLPLKELTPKDIDFYEFGGKINIKQLKNKERVVGVNKELMVIIPTQEGHTEKSLYGISNNELIEMGIPQHIIEERERVLKRRKKIGKTGVFVNEIVPQGQTIEQVLKQLIDSNTLVKKHFRRK